MAWVRLSRTCPSACAFCADAAQLDGAEVPWADIERALNDAAAAGDAEVVLSGGEPTLSPHLLRAIRLAVQLGLRPLLTTNGRTLTSERRARAVCDAGLYELRISIHGAQSTTHDRLVGAPGAWVQALATLRAAEAVRLRTAVHVVVTPHNAPELAELVRLADGSGAARIALRPVEPVGRAADATGLRLSREEAARALALAWTATTSRRIRLETLGFEAPAAPPLPVLGPAPAIDADLVALLRARAPFPSASRGTWAVATDGSVGGLARAAAEAGGLRALGLELAALRHPILDLPACLGGRAATERPGGPAVPVERVKADACRACPVDERCPGLPRAVENRLGIDAVAPAPWWLPAPVARVAVVRSGVPATDAVLDGIERALARRGVEVVGPDDADLVVGVTPDLRGPRVVFLDLEPEATPTVPPDALVWSCAVGQPTRLTDAGVSLDRVRWGQVPLPTDRLGTSGPIPAHAAPCEITDPDDLDATHRALADGAVAVLGPGLVGSSVARAVALALAAGRPVVVARTVLTEALLTHGVDSWLVETGTEQARATELVADRPRLEALARGAHLAASRVSAARFARYLLDGAPARAISPSGADREPWRVT